MPTILSRFTCVADELNGTHDKPKRLQFSIQQKYELIQDKANMYMLILY